MPKAEQVGVTILYDNEGRPDKMIMGNGSAKWYDLKEMSFGDFNAFLGADGVQWHEHHGEE